jgi:tetratricopeptide (TPR) repeat protein
MSIRAYAAHLGVAVATVMNWDARGQQARLRTETQQLLDIDLARASADVRGRFEAALADIARSIEPPSLRAPVERVDTGIVDAYDHVRAWQHGRQDIADCPWMAPDALAELLPAGDVLQPLTATNGRRIGQGTVSDLAARVHRLRLADDVLAGGDLIIPAFRDLRAALKLYREGSHTEVIGRALLVQVGELAQIAGWIASDAGWHDLAEQAYGIGIRAARQAGDATLTANLAGSLAYQHANTGREREGVQLARAALEEAGPDAPPRARALFFDRLAWAHAQAGQAQPAMRALGEAHDALSVDGADEAPQWAYWVSGEELEVMDARVYTELHRPLRAVPLLSRVLDRYDATHARELALYLSWLAVAYADANEPEAAAGSATRMLELSADMASDRTVERARIVLRRLVEFGDVPEVRAVLTGFEAAEVRLTAESGRPM